MISKLHTAIKLLFEGKFTKIWFKIFANLFGKKYCKDSEFGVLVDKSEFKPKPERALEFLIRELNGAKNLGDYLEFGIAHVVPQPYR